MWRNLVCVLIFFIGTLASSEARQLDAQTNPGRSTESVVADQRNAPRGDQAKHRSKKEEVLIPDICTGC